MAAASAESAEGGPVRATRHGEVVVLTIDNPPVNAGSADVRSGLLAGIDRLAAATDVVGAVLIGARGSFISGSDIREFSGPVVPPLLPDVIAAIEACPKPVVAALDGAALGGGLELALGCDLRVATARARLGLPEVTLGMVPGAGGTQRLPRLVGRTTSIDLIVSGTRLDGVSACRLGLVDDLAEPARLLERAVHAAGAPIAKRRVRDLPVPPEDEDRIEAACREGLAGGDNRPQAAEAIALIRSAGQWPVDQALARERRVFDDLRARPEAAALRHVFFAERAASKIADLRSVRPIAVDRVGVIGAGTSAVGIAIAFLLAGYDTMLVENDDADLQAGLGRVREHLRAAVATGTMTASAAGAACGALHGRRRVEELVEPDLLVETCAGEPDVTSASLRRLVNRPGANLVLATNRGDLDELAGEVGHPSAVVGMHFRDPAYSVPFVEVVRGSTSSPQTIKTALAIATRLGMQPIVVGGGGPVGPRLLGAYDRGGPFALVSESASLLREGTVARAGDIDVAMVRGYGFPRHEGGPLWSASRLSSGRMTDAMVELASSTGSVVDVDGVAELLEGVRSGG